MSDLCFQSATQLARLIRERKASAVEVLDAHLQRIEQYNPGLNAIVTLDAAGAHQRAQEADAALARGEIWGSLHGVPMTIKDSLQTAGMRTTSGSRRLANFVPKEDATVVARLRAAGAIIFGKTNLPEFAADAQTNNRLFGRTNNPWDLSRTCGGSSGGAAVAIAAGLSPLDIGSDIGGSIREPAHFCGVFGFKPTDLSVPWVGHIPGATGPWGMFKYLLSIGPLARSAQDLRLAFTLVAGPDERQPDVPPVALAAPPERPLRTLRFAWSDDFGVPVSADTHAALGKLASTLEGLGCRVEHANPAHFDFWRATALRRQLQQCSVPPYGAPAPLPRSMFRMLARWIPTDAPEVGGFVQALGSGLPEYARAMAERDALIRALDQFLAEWDAWLCPVAPMPAFPHVETLSLVQQVRATVEIDGKKVSYANANSLYSCTFNLTGHPVVVLPLAHSKEGLPIGVQVIGRRWHDLELLSTAEQLTEITGPFRPPPLA